LVRERLRLEAMRAFVLLETTNPIVALRDRALGLALCAPSNGQLPLELTQPLLSLTLLDPQPVQLVAHMPELSLACFDLELERALRLPEPEKPVVPPCQRGLGGGERATGSVELVLKRRLAFVSLVSLGAARLLVLLEAAQ